jgi:hypothetical protein
MKKDVVKKAASFLLFIGELFLDRGKTGCRLDFTCKI